MKRVKGFLTTDDVFFPTKEEAELHEATVSLIGSCSQLRLRSDAVLSVIHTLSDQIERYINAKRRAAKHPTIDKSPETDTLPLLELTPRGSEPMPDVGDGERLETLRHSSAFYGSGSWGDDASSVRGSEDLATPAHPGIPEALSASSDEDIWREAVDALHPRVPRR